MKTPEEKKVEREARLKATLMAPRTGYARRMKEEPLASAPALQGLHLSDIELWPLDRFKPHPSNHVFDSAKTDAYWRDLRRDILEAGAIINPVIALPDGTLLEGHSRLRIVRELAAEGHNLGKIPVRLVASPITPADAERRVYLGNLSRFELDDDTRLTLYAKVWPDYFLEEKKPGPPAARDRATVALSPTTIKIVSKATGKSPRQVKYDKAIVRAAAERAREKGRRDANVEDIREARKKAAQKRRVPTNAAGARVTISRIHAEIVLAMLRKVKTNTAQAAAIKALAQALKVKP